MARLFVQANSNELTRSPRVALTRPYVMAGWFRTTNIGGGTQAVVAQVNSSTTVEYFGILVNSSGLHAWSRNGVSSTQATTSIVPSNGVWYQALALYVTSTDRRIYIDGGNPGTDSTSVSAYTSNNTDAIGSLPASSPFGYFEGDLAEISTWNIDGWPGATAADKADGFIANAMPSLAAGFTADHFPLGLSTYVPLLGVNSPESDVKSGSNFTVSGTTKSAHPRIVRRSHQVVVPAPSIFVPPVNEYQMVI